MSSYCLDLWIYQRPDANESIMALHSERVRRMVSLGSQLSWRNALVPLEPVRKKGGLTASYSVKYPNNAIRHRGAYQIRDARYLDNDKTADDIFSFNVRNLNSAEYGDVLRRQFPELIEAVVGYRAIAYLNMYSSKYSHQHEYEWRDLAEQTGADIDGRNNIFTLNVVQYWDAELCQRALGYGRDEVIKRLTGKVPLVQPLMDGVYVVFNDNPDLTFEEFCAYNDRLKPVLGLQ